MHELIEFVDISAEIVDGAGREAEWIIEVGLGELSWVDSHNKLIIRPAAGLIDVVIGTNAVDKHAHMY